MKGYYFITDNKLSIKGNVADVQNAISAGVEIVQYRNKTATSHQMYEEALSLKNLCKKALFLVNDRVDIAMAVEADGVHLGETDIPYEIARKLLGPDKIIGVSVTNLKQAEKAQELGVNYIGLGPVFATTTKLDAAKPLGIEQLEKIRKCIVLPIVAIGGITLENAKQVFAPEEAEFLQHHKVW